MDIERTMEFLLAQQARFAEQQALHEAWKQEMETKHRKLTDAVIMVVGLIGKLSDKVDRLAENDLKREENSRKTEEKLQTVTDNMNALIKVVDELVRRRNGGPAPATT